MVPNDMIEAFVKEHEGDTYISKILIASNGLAAYKGIRSIRNWAYEMFGDQRSITFISMATPEDLDANAEYIKISDDYVMVPSGPNTNNYANVDLIVSLAKRHAVHAVWAGWGHASENPRLPELLSKTEPSIAFIGPSGKSMRALGDKIASIIVAQTANVETIPWSGSGLKMIQHGAESEVSQETYLKGCCSTAEEGLEAAKKIGLPVMIKASEGGGGKGIRRVDMMDQFGRLFKEVQNEVPGSPIFIMKVAENARHLEVQLICDRHGNVTTLFGRDCSIQRRHQKIIEEAPVTIAPKDVMIELEEAAIRLAKLVGYENVGTVEYLYDATTKKYCFLELNPRLQVEHPTTEMISGVNIPASQLMIAMGIPLHRISYIRKLYNQDPESKYSFNLGLSLRNVPNGHVIAARVTAENPDEGFKPNGGAISQVKLAAQHQTWGYFSVCSNGKVHDFSDSQFGHIFAHASDRTQALNLLVETLKGTRISAEFRTTINYVAALLEHQTFKDNCFSTSWLDCLIKEKFSPLAKDDVDVAISAAAFMSNKKFKLRKRVIIDSLNKRHYPSKDQLVQSALCKFIYNKVCYDFEAWMVAHDVVELRSNGQSVNVKIRESADGTLLVSFNQKSQTIQAQDNGHCLNLLIEGQDCLIHLENDPSSVRAPSSGRIVKFLVEDGSKVEKDMAICEIEVMKMYLPIFSKGTGIIFFKRQIGSSISAGDLLASIDLDDKNNIAEIKKFAGSISVSLPSAFGELLEIHMERRTQLDDIFRGYCPADDLRLIVGEFIGTCADPRLAYFKLQRLLENLRTKLPSALVSDLNSYIDAGMKNDTEYYIGKIELFLTAHIADDSNVVSQLLLCLKPHLQGPLSFTMSVLNEVAEGFISCEKLFDTELTFDGPLTKLFELFNTDLEKILEYIQMHSKLESRIACLCSILDKVQEVFPDSFKLLEFQNILKILSSFEAKDYGRLNRKAREILLSSQIPSLDELFEKMEAKFQTALNFAEDLGKRADFINEMVQGFATHLDVIPRFFHHPNQLIRKMALEIYTKRVFDTYQITDKGFFEGNGMDLFEWNFSTQPKEDFDDNSILHRRRPSSATVYPIVGLHGEPISKPLQERKGYMVSLEDLRLLDHFIQQVLFKISQRSDEEPNHLYLVAKEIPGWSDENTAKFIQEVVKSRSAELGLHRVRRITLALVRAKIVAVGFYTFSQSRDYLEDLTIRHIEPAMAYLLEFPRLVNYDIEYCYADSSGQIRIYLGTEKSIDKHQRLFIRLIVRPNQAMRGFESMPHFVPQAYNLLEEVLQAVGAVQAKNRQLYDQNHLFINIVPVFYNHPSDVLTVFKQLVEAYKDRWTELHIRQVEVRMSLAPSKDAPSCRYRFYLNNETGDVSDVYGYQEKKDCLSGFKYLSSLDQQGCLDGYPVTFYYRFMSELQVRRNKMLSLETPYVYDFPQIFEHAIRNSWKLFHAMGGDIPAPAKLMECHELVLDHDNTLLRCNRGAGLNTIGMVAWRIRLFTPEAPTGRDIVVIANDISHEIGSFGVEEDNLFKAASAFARSEGIPRVYLSANSGARIGIAEELKSLIKAAWSSPGSPESGFEYLYLEKDDYESLKPCVVNCEKIELSNGETRYRLVDIIGAKHGLGVENLQGSALIAGETSKAYDEIFTISFVTGRSVGIGAYLVRLGQRVIQKKQHPIILTGVGALNSVLGREVYQSNLQLGGPQIMFSNGVSHRVVKTDIEGVQEIIRWLSFVPLNRSSLPPVLRTRDNPLRHVTFRPEPGQSYDPRWLIEGKQSDGIWLSGLFDRGSFVETLGGWAKGVVTGRARLGGYPVGVIAVETRTMEVVIPADPANLNSTAHCIQQAGQVWFPDSAFKTAQAIRDFTKGESLPVFILANWRGFSGGQRDLYEQILKFGAQIVDALKDVHQPVMVYLPPEAELRGGAWVVVDSQINPEHIEMYADSSARGGILEPEGIIGVKFRPHHFHALMERLDPKCRELTEEIEVAPTPSLKEESTKALTARWAKLMPIYRQIACQFADAHDTPGRMKAKGVIKEIVPWNKSRAFFYHRLRRLQIEAELTGLIKGYRLSTAEKKGRLAEILLDHLRIDISSKDDELVFDRISEHMAEIKELIKLLNISLAKSEISRILSELPADISIEGLDEKFLN